MNLSPITTQFNALQIVLEEQKNLAEPILEIDAKCFAEMQKLQEVIKQEAGLSSTNAKQGLY